MREVNFYKTASGKCPVAEFLEELPTKQRRKVVWVLKLLEDLDFVPKEYWKKLKPSDIWECRVKFGSTIYRIFGFFVGNEIILTHGIVKKTQKTPKEAITKAEKYRKEHIQRRRKK
ncbi:MAG: type II toxin-antitoxin system RelE/ParE family toxin [Candidatus Omnitrophica bacterium]|nr:type II toxin-antitoxin system RelE/ParE family toxin [Candidatus Omnitrophota bacterium]